MGEVMNTFYNTGDTLRSILNNKLVFTSSSFSRGKKVHFSAPVCIIFENRSRYKAHRTL